MTLILASLRSWLPSFFRPHHAQYSFSSHHIASYLIRPIHITMFAARNSFMSHLCRSTKTTATLSPLLRSATALRQRQFSTAPERRLVRDTAYPFPLYYHLLPSTSTPTSTTTITPTTTYALSFLPSFPQHTRQVVGYLSHSTSDSEGSDLQVKPNKFTENEAFNNVLHIVIQQNLADDPMVQSVLQQQLEG